MTSPLLTQVSRSVLLATSPRLSRCISGRGQWFGVCNMALFYYDHKYIIFILCRIICYGKIVVAHLCMRHLPPRRIIVVADLSSADAISLDFRLDRPFIYPLQCRCCFCGLLFKSVSSVFKFLFQGVFHLPVQCLVKFCITAQKKPLHATAL